MDPESASRATNAQNIPPHNITTLRGLAILETYPVWAKICQTHGLIMPLLELFVKVKAFGMCKCSRNLHKGAHDI